MGFEIFGWAIDSAIDYVVLGVIAWILYKLFLGRKGFPELSGLSEEEEAPEDEEEKVICNGCTEKFDEDDLYECEECGENICGDCCIQFEESERIFCKNCINKFYPREKEIVEKEVIKEIEKSEPTKPLYTGEEEFIESEFD